MHKARLACFLSSTLLATASGALAQPSEPPPAPARPAPVAPADDEEDDVPDQPEPAPREPAEGGDAPAGPEPAEAPREGAPGAEGEAGDEEAPGEAQPERPASPEPGASAPATRPAPPRAPTTPLATQPGSELGPGVLPQPEADKRDLVGMGDRKPQEAQADSDTVFAEEWWTKARPILELHGYFRVRAELFHNFSLNRIDAPSSAIWPHPADDTYAGENSTFGPEICTPDEAGRGESDDPAGPLGACDNSTQAGANLRFRLTPELHISSNLRVLSQIDLLDNLVLGSTPNGYSVSPGAGGGYAVNQRDGYEPVGAEDSSAVAPRSGINSLNDSFEVKRAWAEYTTPVGELRFGRMPAHWGLGIFLNSGDGLDDDYQSTLDRIMFVSGIKALDLHIGGAWDFVNEGPTSGTVALPQAQPYDLAQLDDVDQYALMIFRKKSEELTKRALTNGEVVLNGGMYLTYRSQTLANDRPGSCDANAAALDCPPGTVADGFVRRGATAWIPDLWFQLLYRDFRFELEALTVQGSIENTASDDFNYETAPGGEGWDIRQWGFASEIEQRLVENRLKLGFNFGWASGDPDVEGLQPGRNGYQPQFSDNTISTFRFHPAHRIDLILHRNLLTRVQGTYYVRPEVEYDFIRERNGQRFGGAFAAIWSRASEFIQTPGNARDLGIELNGTLYFQSKDGARNDEPGQMGGFYTMLQYGVLFPLGGLKYTANAPVTSDISTPQILRWYLGAVF